MNEFEKKLSELPPVHIGSIYEVKRRDKEGIEHTKKLRCIGLYKNFAMFEHERGYKECINYWSLKGVREL